MNVKKYKKTKRILRAIDISSETLLKSIPFGMDIVDEDGNILFMNEILKSHFGEKAIGKKCWFLYRDDKKQCTNCPLINGIEVGQTATIEADGVLGGRTFLITHTGLNYEGKRAILEIFQDITERKATERALEESEARYRTIYSSSKDAVMVLAPGKKFISGNIATIEMFGCKDEKEFTSNTPADLSPEYQPDGRLSSEKAQEMMAIAMKKGSHFFEWKHKRLNGDEFFATVLLTKMKLGDEGLLQATVRDVNKRKEMENKLRQLSSAVEQSPSMVIITDVKGNIEYTNPKFSRLTGYTLEDIVGQNMRILKSGEHPKELYKKLWATISSGKEWRGELHNKKKNGELYWESASISAIKDSKGNITNFVAVEEDITERKRAEEALRDTKKQLEHQTQRLEQSNRSMQLLYKELEEKNKELQKLDQLKSDFVSTVSHELRTPLSITKEGVSLVLDNITGPTNERQRKTLTTAKDNIDRLARIIDELLDISKIEAGKAGLKRQLVDLRSLISGIVSNFETEVSKAGLKIKTRFPQSRVTLYVDPDKMTQVFINLINNALKFTEKGHIEVSLKDRRHDIECTVSDTGVGIPKEDLHKVFGKFQQFGRKPGAGAKGTGLGLAISKELIEMHQGSIRVESKPKKGAKFIFSIPKMETDEVFKEYINSGIRESVKNEVPLSLVAVHVIGFGDIRKAVGYEKAHSMLKEIETVTKTCLRCRADTVVRDSGDLLVLLLDTKKEDIHVVKGRIEEVVNKFLSENNERRFKDIRVTIGGATYPDEATKDQELLDIVKAAQKTKGGEK